MCELCYIHTMKQITQKENEMETETIKQVLMRRDGMDADAADTLIEEASEQLQKYLAEDDMEAAFYVCEEFFGLEPDYVMELIP